MRSPISIIIAIMLLAGCSGEQSAFSGYSTNASRIVHLTWVLFIGGGFLLLLVVVLTGLALLGGGRFKQALSREGVVVWLGMVMPIAVLTGLQLYGFVLLRIEAMPMDTEGAALRVHIEGEQWWWRVIYQHPDGTTTESANELRFPVGQPVELTLTTADVIHSFWLPAYGGKVDMIPGRSNSLRFFPTQTGVTRGQCAEYCGGAHALMAFYAVAMEPEEFQQWLEREKQDTRANDPAGEQTFLTNGCGGCHAVRGTPATGVIGPDLTHVGSRLSIGAGILAADQAGFRQWLARHQQIKPQNLMPPYEILNEDELALLAAYLVALE